MQQIQPDSLGVMSIPVAAQTRHDGLVLIGAPAPAMQIDPLPPAILRRLLSPAARIEGVDCRLNDPALLDRARSAHAFVMLLPPLGNLGNPFYSVHPRRNDRFLAARPMLKALFPEVDFTEYDFTGHMLSALAATCPDRFSQMRRVLQQTWQERLKTLLEHMPDGGVLLQLPGPAWLAAPSSALASKARPLVTFARASQPDAPDRLRSALEPALRILHA